MNVSEIADELYRELDQPSDILIPSIIFWLQCNIGNLNISIDTGYIINPATLEISPELGEDEKAIYKYQYYRDYYERQARKNLYAGAYATFSEVKEGNRTVKRTNKTTIANVWGAMSKDLADRILDLIAMYKVNRCTPGQTYVPPPMYYENWPTNGIGNARYGRNNYLD